MARSDNNLTAVFTDTANAIRSKTGGRSQISPRDFADEIATIEVTPANEYKQMFYLISGECFKKSNPRFLTKSLT